MVFDEINRSETIKPLCRAVSEQSEASQPSDWEACGGLAYVHDRHVALFPQAKAPASAIKSHAYLHVNDLAPP